MIWACKYFITATSCDRIQKKISEIKKKLKKDWKKLNRQKIRKQKNITGKTKAFQGYK